MVVKSPDFPITARSVIGLSLLLRKREVDKDVSFLSCSHASLQ